MISRNTICILFISLALTATLGCVAQEKIDPNTSSNLINYVPQGKNIPAGFEYILIETNAQEDTSKNIFKANMTDEIKEFFGNKTIMPVNFALGRYKQSNFNGDGKATIIEMKDDSSAKDAVLNYLDNFKKEYPFKLQGNVSLTGSATINAHDVNELMKPESASGGYFVVYNYLWTNKNLVILVEGSPDRSKSMELASATGL